MQGLTTEELKNYLNSSLNTFQLFLMLNIIEEFKMLNSVLRIKIFTIYRGWYGGIQYGINKIRSKKRISQKRFLGILQII